MGDNFSIYHYDILKKNLGAMPCRMYQVRLFIDALCLIKTMSLNVLLRGVMIYICPQSGQVRVSPASFGSQSWVGCYQGYTGGVEGQGAENWCVGEARRRGR